MRIKCIKCETIEELDEEDTKLLGHVVRRYNPEPKPNDYIMVLNVIKGNCTDGNKHIYVFDSTFDKAIANLIKEYNDLCATNTTRDKTISGIDSSMNTIKTHIEDFKSKITALESQLKDCIRKKEGTITEIKGAEVLINETKLSFEKLTGSQDMKIWS